MGNVDKEQLIKVRNLFRENPDLAKEIIKSDPSLMNMIATNSQQESQSVNGVSNTKENQLTKSIPGIPKMFDDNGFSNYLMLAILAFSIQFIITLICIFFYK